MIGIIDGSDHKRCSICLDLVGILDNRPNLIKAEEAKALYLS